MLYRIGSLAIALCLVALDAQSQESQPLGSSYGLTDGPPLSADEASLARAASFSQTTDPLAFHRNPALLAGLGRAGGGYATRAGAIDYGLGDLGIGGIALAVGTDRVGNRPLSVGAALSRTVFDFGRQVWTDAEGNPIGSSNDAETAWSAAAGAGWTGPVEVDLGIALHRRASVSTAQSMGSPEAGERVRGTTLDVGGVLTVPVLGRTPQGSVSPALDLSTGYTQRHIAVTTSRPEGFGSLPSTVRVSTLGYAIRAGLDVPIGWGSVPLILIDSRVEADAALDRFLCSQGCDQIGSGEGEVVRDLLVGAQSVRTVALGEGDDVVVGRRAVRVTLFDTVSYTRGHFGGTGYPGETATWGVGFDGGGALRGIGLAVGNRGLTDLGTKATIQVSYGVRNVVGVLRSTYGGVTVGWRP